MLVIAFAMNVWSTELFLKSFSATETKALPFHRGSLPTVEPNRLATFSPKPPLFVGKVALKFAVPLLKSSTPVLFEMSSLRPPCSFGTIFLTTPLVVNPKLAAITPC